MSRRIEKIRGLWSDARLENLPGIRNETANIIFETAVSVDPTPQKKMLSWLLDAWENGGLLWEDIQAGAESKTAETLADFERLKRLLVSHNGQPDIPARSLMQYATPGQIWNRIKPLLDKEQEFGESLTARQFKKTDSMKASLESMEMTMPSGLKITVPMTRFASEFHGRGTRWCTSGEKDNMFFAYQRTGPLVIFTLPGGEKFQAHLNLRHDEEPGGLNEIIDTMTNLNVFDIKNMETQDIVTFMNDADDVPSPKEQEILQPYLSEISNFLGDFAARNYVATVPSAKKQQLAIQKATTSLVEDKIMTQKSQTPITIKATPKAKNNTGKNDEINLFDILIDSNIIVKNQEGYRLILPTGQNKHERIKAFTESIGRARYAAIKKQADNDGIEMTFDVVKKGSDKSLDIAHEMAKMAKNISMPAGFVGECLDYLANRQRNILNNDELFMSYILLNENHIKETMDYEATRLRNGTSLVPHLVSSVASVFIAPGYGQLVWGERHGANGWSHFCLSQESDIVYQAFGFNDNFGNMFLRESLKAGASVDNLIEDLFNEKRARLRSSMTADTRRNITKIIDKYLGVLIVISEAIERNSSVDKSWGNAQNLGMPLIKKICKSLDPTISDLTISLSIASQAQYRLYPLGKERKARVIAQTGMPGHEDMLARIASESQNNLVSETGKAYFSYWLEHHNLFNISRLPPEIRAPLDIIKSVSYTPLAITNNIEMSRKGPMGGNEFFPVISELFNISYGDVCSRCVLSSFIAYPNKKTLETIATNQTSEFSFQEVIENSRAENNQAMIFWGKFSDDKHAAITTRMAALNEGDTEILAHKLRHYNQKSEFSMENMV